MKKLRVLFFVLLMLVTGISAVFAATYTDVKNQFSVQVPDGWDITKSGDSIKFNTPGRGEWGGARIHIYVNPHNTHKQDNGPGVPIRILEESNINVNGIPGKLKITLIGANGNFKSKHIMLFVKDMEYSFYYSSVPGLYEKYLPSFDSLINSFTYPIAK